MSSNNNNHRHSSKSHRHHHHSERTPLRDDQEPAYDPMGEVPDESDFAKNQHHSSSTRHSRIVTNSPMIPRAQTSTKWAFTGSIITLIVAGLVSILLWAGWMANKLPGQRHGMGLVESAFAEFSEHEPVSCPSIVNGVWLEKCLYSSTGNNAEGMEAYVVAITPEANILKQGVNNPDFLAYGTFEWGDPDSEATDDQNCQLERTMITTESEDSRIDSFEYNTWDFPNEFFSTQPGIFCTHHRIAGKECRHYINQMVDAAKEWTGEEWTTLQKDAHSMC